MAVAARTPDKPALKKLESEYNVRCYQCDAREPEAVTALFQAVDADLGRPTLVVHNIDGRTPDIFRKDIDEADPGLVRDTLLNSAYSAFLVGQQAVKGMLAQFARCQTATGGPLSLPMRARPIRATRGVGRLRWPVRANRAWPRVWPES